MLERILRLYVMAMAGDVRSPLPHLFGPPGCGKSTVVEQAAALLGVNLHIINVSRISPLEVEGVQMPHGSGEDMLLRMLPATFWTQLREGDILLLDEFLRGFPEVYNALLDILTSRRVGAFVLPKVFIIAASNSTVAYDKALEDRLLHLPVPDPRSQPKVRTEMKQRLVDTLGLMPEMVRSVEIEELFVEEILPMYEILDALKNKQSTPPVLKGRSMRNLIGQAQLREVQSSALVELLRANNTRALRENKAQYVLLYDGKKQDDYTSKAEGIPEDKLTAVQLLNMQLNAQLIELEVARARKEVVDDGDIFDDGEEPPF